jgi:NAD(P)-dependent dehydrogenase (short-subunit alcohol dehydrogenase family)
MSMKTWFITGTSKGFGRVWTNAALARGDRVVATARDPRALDDLVAEFGALILPLPLDVDDTDSVEAAVAAALEHFGRLDVVVNNAGSGLFGAVEEISDQQARALMETNFFGTLRVTKAVLPHLRQQRSGRILQVSSIGGVLAFPGVGLYHASKWALEGLSQALAAEMAPFGVKVTLIEPVGYATDWVQTAVRADPLPAYEPIRAAHADNPVRTRLGSLEATGPAILDLVDADDPPLRVFFGDWALERARAEYEDRLRSWERWDGLAARAHGKRPS